MTHFLFLEKGAQMRDTQRAPREKVAGDAAPALPIRPGEPTDGAAAPGLLYLVLPMGDGYRVFRAPLEEVADLPVPADRAPLTSPGAPPRDGAGRSTHRCPTRFDEPFRAH